MAGRDGHRALVVPMSDLGAAVEAIAALHERSPLDAVVGGRRPGRGDRGRGRRAARAPRTTRPARSRRPATRPPCATPSPRPRARSRGSGSSTTSSRSPTWPTTSATRGREARRASASRGVIRADDADVRACTRPKRIRDHGRRAAARRGVPPRRSRSRSKGSCAASSARGPRDLRQARPARRPVLRGDDLRHTVAAPRRDAAARRAVLTWRATRAHRAHRRADPRRAAHRRRPRLGDRGRGAVDRWPVRAHAAVRRRHRARGADPPPRARPPHGRALVEAVVAWARASAAPTRSVSR